MADAIKADNVRLKRAYDPPGGNDGRRILVDRLWPRGVSKAEADIDEWVKDLAPSTELRKWFGHDPARWAEFRRRYFQELDQSPEAVATLVERARRGTLTLIYSAKDTEHNQARALAEYLKPRLR